METADARAESADRAGWILLPLVPQSGVCVDRAWDQLGLTWTHGEIVVPAEVQGATHEKSIGDGDLKWVREVRLTNAVYMSCRNELTG